MIINEIGDTQLMVYIKQKNKAKIFDYFFWYYFLFDRGMEAYIKKVIDEKFKTINSIIGKK